MSDHHHDHHHAGHVHAPQNFGRAFAIGIGLNAAFVLVEAGYGFVSNSTALLADAGHNLSDVLGLVVAWIAAMLSRRPPTPRLTYGLRNTSILAALLNAVLLLIAAGAIILEAIQRLLHPEPVAGILIMLTGWLWVDPVTSLVIVAVIVWGTWGLLRESTAMSLAAVPSAIDPATVRDYLAGLPGVVSIHDLHIWPMSTTETALTAHLVMPQGQPGDAFLHEIAHELEHRFHIGHATVQVETGHEHDCTLQGAHGEHDHD